MPNGESLEASLIDLSFVAPPDPQSVCTIGLRRPEFRCREPIYQEVFRRKNSGARLADSNLYNLRVRIELCSRELEEDLFGFVNPMASSLLKANRQQTARQLG